jgi:16S rRNA (adenine1518-N6/adenine1519-N6)-dimethyltransferase
MHYHKPRKRFGQNFLKDHSIIEQIIGAINPVPTDCVLEIGPGLGALTQYLIDSGADVNAVEIDLDLGAYLSDKFKDVNNFTLFQQDFLKFDISQLPSTKLKVVGNLPYNISTPIMFKIFDSISLISELYFMVQYEVAERLLAQPSCKEYGRLSVMAQYFCDISMVMEVPNTAFDPKPQVLSAIIRLQPKVNANKVVDINMLRNITTMAFNMRRKVISNSLKPVILPDQLANLNINPQLRPENLSMQDFVKISNFVAGNS